jgi:hypothetical protein
MKVSYGVVTRVPTNSKPLGRTTDQRLVPQIPKKRPSFEALDGDTEREKKPNQAKGPSQETSFEDQEMLDPSFFVMKWREQREWERAQRERDDKTVKRPVRQVLRRRCCSCRADTIGGKSCRTCGHVRCPECFASDY